MTILNIHTITSHTMYQWRHENKHSEILRNLVSGCFEFYDKSASLFHKIKLELLGFILYLFMEKRYYFFKMSAITPPDEIIHCIKSIPWQYILYNHDSSNQLNLRFVDSTENIKFSVNFQSICFFQFHICVLFLFLFLM